MATNLAALMPAPFGATSLGAVITVGATYSGLIVARTAAPGTISREISRQERGMLVTIWAPSPQARASIATLLMTAILKIDFLALPDGSAAWLRYRQSNESDGKENAMAYRRDIGLWVEYANIETAIGYPITAPIVTQTLSPYLPPSANPAAPTGAIVLTFGASGGNPTGLVVYEIIAASSGAQNINVGQSISKIDSLYLNGVRQAQGQVTFIGTTVTLPAGLGIISGDLITIIFS